MKTRLVLKPGDRGTRKVVDEFGGKLVCVRYRYDEVHKRRLKTAEIILEEVPWEPRGAAGLATAAPDRGGGTGQDGGRLDPVDPGAVLVWVRLAYEERALRQRVKDAGGQWQSGRRLWELDLGTARRLGLEGRIVSGERGG